MTAVCLAVPTAAPAFQSSALSSTIQLQTTGSLVIPESLGTLEEFKPGRSGKTFILIQDAHQSFEAQQHIADLIELFVRQGGVKTIFEEGYEGPVPTDELMEDIADPVVKQRVSYYLMDQLLIGGAEYAHINRGSWRVNRESKSKGDLTASPDPRSTTHDFALIGADKLREHFDSVAWYGKAARVQAQVDRDLSTAEKELERLIPHFVSKDMRHLMKVRRAHEIQKIDFIAYLREIAGQAIAQTGSISFSVDYPGLAGAVRALDSKQADAIEAVRKLAARDLWRELEQLESELQQRLLKTDTEKAILQFYDKIQGLKRLNKIEMTASEYERIKITVSGLHTQELANFIAQQGKSTVVLSREWEDQIRYALSFYETALARDGAVREAAEFFMKNPEEQTAVLVYGGFHTGRIREILQSLDVTYAVVSPRISRADKKYEERYRSLMSGGSKNSKAENINQLSRPLSAVELRMNGRSEIRLETAAQIQALREVMRSLPVDLSLPQAAREAQLKLKVSLSKHRSDIRLFTAKSEVRALEDKSKSVEAVLTMAEVELSMEKQGFPELKLLWNTFKKMKVLEGLRLRPMRFEDIDDLALSVARVRHMGGWLVKPRLMIVLSGAAALLLRVAWTVSMGMLFGGGADMLPALRSIFLEPSNVIEMGLGAFLIYLGAVWVKRTILLSWKKISALDLARMLSKPNYRQWFDQTAKAKAAMNRLLELGVNALWDNVSYRKYYRSTASGVEEVPPTATHTVHEVLSNVLGESKDRRYQPGAYTASLKKGKTTVTAFVSAHKKEIELSKKGQLPLELGVQLLKTLLAEYLRENSKGARYVATAINTMDEKDIMPDGAVEVRVWERNPWTDLNRPEDFYSSASLRGNRLMDHFKRRTKGLLGPFGYLRNKSISALDFRTREGRTNRVRMAAVTYLDKTGQERPMLFVDAVEGRLSIKLRLIKKAIEDYALAAGFDGVFYYKFGLNTVPQKFVAYVADHGGSLEELAITYVDASEREYLDAFSYVYEPFEYAYPKGKTLGYVVDFSQPANRTVITPSSAYVFWGKVKKRYSRWTLNTILLGLAGALIAKNNPALILPFAAAAGLTLYYELRMGRRALINGVKDSRSSRSEVRNRKFIADIRTVVENDKNAQKMNYAERFDSKAAKLLTYFPKPGRSLQPFFEEILLNASIKDTELENVLKFLNGIKEPHKREAVETLLAVIWPKSDKAMGELGLSVEKGARDQRRAELLSKLDSVRKFVKVTSLTKREIQKISKFQKRLGLEIGDVLNIISISPTILRGLSKSPRPIYAWVLPTVVAMVIGYGILWFYPNIPIPAFGALLLLTIIPGTYFISTTLPIAPGILYYSKTRHFLRQLFKGEQPQSEIAQMLERIGVDPSQFQQHREYENTATGVRIVVRDKHQLEDAIKFLTSSEDIDNCIALRNFVAWALPSLLNDDGIVLADIYSKGSGKRYAHRGQMWMIAAEEDGEPVLVVNSFEFNNEGAKYVGVLMPEAIKVLQDVANRAGFKKIYTGITEFSRQYLDNYYPQGQSKKTIKKIHSAQEAGFQYQFDIFSLRYSISLNGLKREYVYQKKRSLTARAYTLIFGLIELLKGNKAKTNSFWEAAKNPNNFWEIPLEDVSRSEMRAQPRYPKLNVEPPKKRRDLFSDQPTKKQSKGRSEVRSQDLPLAAVAVESKTAIRQAFRLEKTGLAARIANALPHLYTAGALEGRSLTATTVLQRLNADMKYAIRLAWKKGVPLLSLVEDDGFEIAMEGQPETWIDIDKPLWTEAVPIKHPWRPLVEALISGLRPDQRRLINEQTGYGPRLAQLYTSARSEQRQVGQMSASADSSESARSELRRPLVSDGSSQRNPSTTFNHPEAASRAALLDFNDLVTFSSDETREAAIVMKQRSEVRFLIYNAAVSHEKLLHFKRLFGFRNVTWTQSGGETAFQSLGAQFKDGSVVGFSRGGQDSTGGFSLASRKKMNRFKLSAKKPGTLATALSFDPEDPRYRWGFLREGDFYVVADTLASFAVKFLNQFVVAVSA